MGPKKLKDRLVKFMQAGYPMLIKGAPGVGKSDVVTQAAKELEYDLILTHPVVSDPTDYKGLPGFVPDKKTGEMKAEFLPFGDLRAMIDAKDPTIVFIDDLGQAPAVVQAACMQLLLARRINGHHVSKHVVFVAATNRRQDQAGVTGILEPVKSRFHAIYEMEPDVDDWVEWALQHNMPAEIIGFIRFRPNLLSSGEATRDIVNHPCPRTITHAGDLIAMGCTDIEDFAGAIGDGAAAELVGFIKTWADLPDIDAILMGEKQPIPKTPAGQYAVVSALVCKTTKNNAERVLKYVNGMSADFAMLFVRDALRKDAGIKHTKAFIEWCSKHSEYMM